MDLKHWTSSDQVALRAFYDAGQVWSYATIDAAASPPSRAIRDWLEESPPPRWNPQLLPVFRRSSSDTEWLAIAFSDAQAEELRSQLQAFLGPVGCDYRGRRAILDPSDPIDAVALAWAGGQFAYRIIVLPASRPVVRASLDRLRQVWRLRPFRGSYVFRTTAALLREFFTALANNDVAASKQWLAEISQSGRLSAENLRFLEIERFAAHGEWNQIALHPQLTLLTAIRRPRRITALIVDALWRAEFAEFLVTNKPDEAIEHMRTKFLPRFEGLLRSRGGSNHPSVVLTFLVAAVATTPPRRDQIPVLVSAVTPGTPERAFADAIAGRVAPAPQSIKPDNPLQRVKDLLAAKDFDSAWECLNGLSATPAVCELILECAVEIYTIEAANVAIAGLAALSELDRGSLLSRRRSAWAKKELDELIAASAGPNPKDWESWLTALAADPNWPQAVTSAQSATGAWDLRCYQSDPARVRRLANNLQTISPVAWANARYALPHLARYFLADPVHSTIYAPLFHSLLVLLAVDDQFATEDWRLAQNLAAAVLEAGPNEAIYSELVDGLTVIWETHGQLHRLDWALDVLDLLIDTPVRAPGARDRFYMATWRFFSSHPRRIGKAHRELFRLICMDLQRHADYLALPAASTTEIATSDLTQAEALRNKIIGIYTLTCSAAIRAKALIEEEFPGVEVRLNHDHVGSVKLANLAREADFLMVVATSAKHAATDFIKQKRPQTKSELIYPAGRGSSSIVSALLKAVREIKEVGPESQMV